MVAGACVAQTAAAAGDQVGPARKATRPSCYHALAANITTEHTNPNAGFDRRCNSLEIITTFQGEDNLAISQRHQGVSHMRISFWCNLQQGSHLRFTIIGASARIPGSRRADHREQRRSPQTRVPDRGCTRTRSALSRDERLQCTRHCPCRHGSKPRSRYSPGEEHEWCERNAKCIASCLRTSPFPFPTTWCAASSEFGKNRPWSCLG